MGTAHCEDQLEAFKSIARDLVARSQAGPGTLGHEWFAAAGIGGVTGDNRKARQQKAQHNTAYRVSMLQMTAPTNLPGSNAEYRKRLR